MFASRTRSSFALISLITLFELGDSSDSHRSILPKISCSNDATQRDFLGRCFCRAGYFNDDDGEAESSPCSKLVHETHDCICRSNVTMMISGRCAQLCSASEDAGIVTSYGGREGVIWNNANQLEFDYWHHSTNELHEDGDRPEEHARAYNGFRSLYENGHLNLGHVMEAGAGPFTQIKNIMENVPDVKISRITLIEPNIYRYMSLPTCSYKSGSLAGKETILISGCVEHVEFFDAFDTVISINVVEHVVDAFDYLTRVYQALKPGGLLIFHDRWHSNPEASSCILGPYELHPVRVSREVLEHFLSWFDGQDEAYHFTTQKTPEALARANIHECKQTGFDETGYYVIARKKLSG